MDPFQVSTAANSATWLAPLLLAAVVGLYVTLAVAAGNVLALFAQTSPRSGTLFPAQRDELTGLPNRAGFQRLLERRVGAAPRESASLSLVAIDLDGFQEINDRFGLIAGDEALREFSRRLRKAATGAGFVARLGGDEFAIVSCARPDEALQSLLSRLAAIFERPFRFGATEHTITASIGVAAYPSDGADLEALVNAADLAMHQAKAAGGARVRFYNRSMDEQGRARRKKIADLRAAIAADALQVYYQPEKSVCCEATLAYEALLRWPHPELGFVPPSEFIPLAEDNGLIEALGAWVLRAACAEAATWKVPSKVAVNVSALQLSSATDLVDLVRRTLAATGLPASRLELELTESAVVLNSERSLAVMREIRALGVTFALDDFGTGHSSLSTLRAFPFDKIKLDRSFMAEIDSCRQAQAILGAVTTLGRILGIPVLAEGIETASQFAVIRAAGCDQVQGYLLGRPAPMPQTVEGVELSPAPACECDEPCRIAVAA